MRRMWQMAARRGGLLLHLARDRRLSKDERTAIQRLIEEIDE
jgi:hypothetical protein